MNTVYDWITMIIFGGLVVLFLHRSVGPAHPSDRIYHYLPPALGCAIANYLGNNDHKWPAIALTIAVVGYILLVMKPFDKA
ncbi:MAG TPA: hypothetical protein VN723_13325 [Rhizomicrobium sp.]|nr:hypothetical protein [Rhizomicrobium sp.]